MWFVVPEALFDYHDYQQWIQDVAMDRNISFNPQNEVQFNILSQQAWTHLLMQIIKVLCASVLLCRDCMITIIIEGFSISSCDYTCTKIS